MPYLPNGTFAESMDEYWERQVLETEPNEIEPTPTQLVHCADEWSLYG